MLDHSPLQMYAGRMVPVVEFIFYITLAGTVVAVLFSIVYWFQGKKKSRD